ncbi:hypothetical protein MNEG_7687 [Monoraphidium neglectum]|uniref:Uncharacterized protein n=1 Tax=Monoraphidium neglectum TaxID=145388 RepID=A0A0D2MAG4_9CHLO|nr:hypothetical protein MNEG_7687 [Monoraphidium neglectum]KIZ00275.1 hypothetical protein MNEG_7687 [Monoraphidium neglectum]|eukprot:XP_013899294.1 hypothetical protein MNEG_7687 [Monoraphidium neglectum]
MAAFILESGPALPRVRLRAPDAAAAAERLAVLRSEVAALMVVSALQDGTALPLLLLAPLPGCGPGAAGQIELALAALDTWEGRLALIHADRSRLRADAAAARGAPARLAEIVGELNANLQEGVCNYLTAWLVVFCNVARPEQFAAYMLACAPWVPSMPCVQAGLRALMAAAPAAAPAVSAGPELSMSGGA